LLIFYFLTKKINTVHKGGIFSLVIVDDDTYVTGSSDRTVKVFGLKDHKFIKEIRFNSDITALSTLKRVDGSVLVLVGLYGGFAVLS
jgi:WD40 repeat protein